MPVVVAVDTLTACMAGIAGVRLRGALLSRDLRVHETLAWDRVEDGCRDRRRILESIASRSADKRSREFIMPIRHFTQPRPTFGHLTAMSFSRYSDSRTMQGNHRCPSSQCLLISSSQLLARNFLCRHLFGALKHIFTASASPKWH